MSLFSLVCKGQEPGACVGVAPDNVSATELQPLSLITAMFSCCLLSAFTVKEEIMYLQVWGAMLSKDTSVSSSWKYPVLDSGCPSRCSLLLAEGLLLESLLVRFLLQFWPNSSLTQLLPPVLHWISVLGSWCPRSSELEARSVFHSHFKLSP